MRVDLNLATRPFGRSRLLWVACALSAAALLAIGAGLAWTYFARGSVSPEVVAERERLEARLRDVVAEEARLRSMLGEEASIDVYDRSHFLNQLLTRKGVSWKRTFDDVAAVLPPRVLMMQIRPEVADDNQVHLEMQVGAETWQDFIEFVSALESSEVFGHPDVRGYSPPNDNEPYYRFQLTVKYAQQL